MKRERRLPMNPTTTGHPMAQMLFEHSFKDFHFISHMESVKKSRTQELDCAMFPGGQEKHLCQTGGGYYDEHGIG